MKRAHWVLGLSALLGCSSTPSDTQSPPAASAGNVGSAGSPGASGSGGQVAGAGSSTAGAAPATAGTTSLSGAGGASAGAGSNGGSAGAALAGAAGSLAQAGGSAGSAGAAGFVCSQVQGLTLTRQWYLADFEKHVVDSQWQMRAAQSAYVDEWAKSNSPFWATAAESPCQTASASPDRVVFVVLSWTIMAQADWQTAIQGAVDATKTHYPNLRRIDLMTIIRGPNNMACGDPNTYAESTHIPAALDAALVQVAAASPALVHVAPQFAVDACSDFDGVGPHLTTAGNTKLAAKIAAAFAN